MMKQKAITFLSICLLLAFHFISVEATPFNVYVGNIRLIREISSVSGFDMIPILDIAGELGIYTEFDGNNLKISDEKDTYFISANSASVTSVNGAYYGFDIVPQWINHKFMIQLDFVRDILGKSVFWDNVTNSMFIGSDSLYDTLCVSSEYLNAKKYLGMDFETRFASNPIENAFQKSIGLDYSTYGMVEATYNCANVWIEETDYVYNQLVEIGAPEAEGKYTWYEEACAKVRAEEDAYVPCGGSMDRLNYAAIHMEVFENAAKKAYQILYKYNPGYEYNYKSSSMYFNKIYPH